MRTIIRTFLTGIATVALLAGCGGGDRSAGDAQPAASPTPSPTGPPTGCTIVTEEFMRSTLNTLVTAQSKPTEDELGGKDYQCEYSDVNFRMSLSLKVYPTDQSAAALAQVGRRHGQVTEVTGVGEAAYYALIGAVDPKLVQYVAVRKDGGTAYLVLLIGSQPPNFEQVYATVAKKALEGPRAGG